MAIFGGVSSKGYLGDLCILGISRDDKKEIEDSTSSLRLKGKWSSPVVTGTIPCARGYSSLVYGNGKIYLFGGVADGLQFLNEIHCLDLKTFRWSNIKPFREKVAPKPPGRCGTTVVISGNLLILFGGLAQGYKHYNDVWAFDLSSRSWIALFSCSYEDSKIAAPSPRRNAFGAICEYKLLIIGGKGKASIGTKETSREDAFLFDIKASIWSPLSSNGNTILQKGVSGGITARVGNNLIFQGGLTDSDSHTSSDVLTCELGVKGRPILWKYWSSIGHASIGRGLHGGMVARLVDRDSKNGKHWEHYMVIFGGSDNKLDMNSLLSASVPRELSLSSSSSK